MIIAQISMAKLMHQVIVVCAVQLQCNNWLSLSETHADETNVRSLPNILLIINFYGMFATHATHVPLYILYTVCDIFQHQPRGRMKETSACHV